VFEGSGRSSYIGSDLASYNVSHAASLWSRCHRQRCPAWSPRPHGYHAPIPRRGDGLCRSLLPGGRTRPDHIDHPLHAHDDLSSLWVVFQWWC